MTLPTASLSLVLALSLGITAQSKAADTLPPLRDGKAPQTLEELWQGFDPRADPIEEQIVKEWEEDGVYISIVRYCIGTFKGEKSWMAAYYARPLEGDKLPGLVQVHGGGQAASKEKAILDAKRGYACISINWGGNRFYKEEDLGADAQTYWGNIDGSQQKVQKDIDPIESQRNDKYFVRTLGARRALTFLENQEEVDPEKLGMYGFSMGGNITIRVAGIDDRVKVAAPCVRLPWTRWKAPSITSWKAACHTRPASPAQSSTLLPQMTSTATSRISTGSSAACLPRISQWSGNPTSATREP